MDVAEVGAWLGAAYPEHPVKVAEVFVPSVKPPSRRSAESYALFEQAFQGRSSRQHGWLKWFAFNWLAHEAQFEAEIFVPPVLGKSSINERGKVLQRGHRYRATPGCRFQRADVVCFDRLAEVGVTSPQSLIEPLWCYAVNEVIWLPFQSLETHEDWLDFSAVNVGFSLRRAKSWDTQELPK